MNFSIRIGLLAVGLATLGACDLGGWLGDPEPPPLPGERLPVLSRERNLQPDASVSDRRVLLPRPYVNREWPQAGGVASHAMYHLTLGVDLREVWSADIGEGPDDDIRLMPEPLVADGRVFAMDAETRVTAIDAFSGGRIWSFNLTPEEEERSNFGGGMAYDSGVLIVTTGFAQVIALRADNGALLWRAAAPAPIRGAPTTTDGRIFVVTLDNKVIAYALRDGVELWRHNVTAEEAGLYGGTSPATDGTVVVAPYSSGEIFGFRADSGRVIWTESAVAVRRTDALGAISDIRAKPVIDRDLVLVIGHGDLMVAIDVRSGVRVWDREIGGVSTPWVAGDFVYVLSNQNQLICLTRDTGQIRWIQQLPRYADPEDRDEPIIWHGPILASNRLIFAGSHGEIWAISPYTGRLLGAVEVSAGVSSLPIVADRTLFLITDEGELLALR